MLVDATGPFNAGAVATHGVLLLNSFHALRQALFEERGLDCSCGGRLTLFS